jgi:D-glycero-D-manno-heptose 1,7-bisphosphate phosphatase
MNLKDLSFTKSWALFLDRDGVINCRVAGEYITRWADFQFLEGVLEAIAELSKIFGYIFIVSNQQGIGKGMMNADDMSEIDKMMKKQVTHTGGRIDASYYSPFLASENHPDRKPGSGMALKAKADFPEIDFTRSVMVGDTISDMEFGKRLGMVTVLISDEKLADNELVDLHFRSLLDFTSYIK